MYRRNISHILYPAAGILGLVIVYETWLKPVSVRSPSTEADIETQQLEEVSRQSLREEAQEPPPPSNQRRMIDPGVLPGSKYHEGLTDIRDDIEKGDFQSAEAKLADLPSAMESAAQIRPYIAILWNNLGIEQEKREGTKVSLNSFKKAASFDGKNPVIQLNLAHAYWEQRDPAMTTEFLERLMALAPNESFPHLAMAELLQEQNRLSEAARHLAQAADRAGNDPVMQSYLRTVTAKVRRTEQAEERLFSRESTHFTVKYDGENEHEAWPTVLEILEEAYREIGQKFGHFPSKPIVVVLHAKSSFQSATGSPAWADGLFDPVLGRIQVPTQGALTDRLWLRRVLRHEFVHALLHDRQGLNSTAMPTWLNEGLAMQLSGDHWSDIEQAEQQDVPVIPLQALEGGWSGLSSDAAAVAYREANSAARYLIDRYGMHEVQQLLSRLKAKHTLSSAMLSQLSLSYDQFQSLWLEQLREERKKG
jgi:tetratricopeptide (TPR) repeat protein